MSRPPCGVLPKASPVELRLVQSTDSKLKLVARQVYERRYSSAGFVGGVAAFLAGMLPKATKRLDGTSTRHVLVDSCGQLIDFELTGTRSATPEDRISKRVPYRFEQYQAPQALMDLVATLAPQYGILQYATCPSTVPEVLLLLEAALPHSRALTTTHTRG